MQLIVIPFLIIIIILGFYYFDDIWRDANPPIPFLESEQTQPSDTHEE